jgi:hypothetical protein
LGSASYHKYLLSIDKFENRAVKFGYLKYVTPVLDLLDAADSS